MKHFIVCTNSAIAGDAGANAAERNAITDRLKAKGWPVWHWFEDVWLVVDPLGETRPVTLREELRSLIDSRTFILVMQIDPLAFSGFGNAEGWPWMIENWGKSE
jgi:hypothetical protein